MGPRCPNMSFGWQAPSLPVDSELRLAGHVAVWLNIVRGSQYLQCGPSPKLATSSILVILANAFTPDSDRSPPAGALRHNARMSIPQTIVYVIKSEADPTRYYTGLTSNLAGRLNAHNAGRVPHTSDGKPWIVDVILEFSDERRAVAFEKYLKSGSGSAFAKRHLR